MSDAEQHRDRSALLRRGLRPAEPGPGRHPGGAPLQEPRRAARHAGWPEGIKALVRMLFAAFPDDQHDVEDVFAAGDRVAARHLPPSGRHVSQAEIHVIRLEAGRLVEHWGCRDDLGFLRQMGAPAPEVVKAYTPPPVGTHLNFGGGRA